MKTLLIVSSFVVAPFFSAAAVAGGCENGHYAEKQVDSEGLLIAKEADPELLLLEDQREQEIEQSPVPTYN